MQKYCPRFDCCYWILARILTVWAVNICKKIANTVYWSSIWIGWFCQGPVFSLEKFLRFDCLELFHSLKQRWQNIWYLTCYRKLSRFFESLYYVYHASSDFCLTKPGAANLCISCVVKLYCQMPVHGMIVTLLHVFMKQGPDTLAAPTI